MFIKILSVLSLFSFVFLLSCTKEMTSKSTDLTNISFKSDELTSGLTQIVDTSKGWYGQYSGSYGHYPEYSDSIIIKNGVAELPPISQTFDFTNVVYEIPSGHTISGDSLIFEATVKNPKAGSYYDYDVILQIYGDKNMAQVQFVADESSQQYDQFFVGNSINKGIPNLVYYFEDFKIVRLVLQKDKAAVFVNNKLLYGFSYGAANRVGNVNKINIAGKGFVVVDSVQLSNSYSKKPILSENFNTDGKSHTIYY